MRWRRFAAFTALAALMADAACQTPSLTATSVSTEDPCDTVAMSDLEATLGFPVADPHNPVERGAPPPVSMVGMEFCRFTTDNDAGRPSFADVGVATAFADVVFSDYKGANKARLSRVDGLGSEAIWDQATQMLLVFAGDRVLAVGLKFGHARVHHEKARTVRLMKTSLEED